jgi:hypothetical protein
MKQSTKLSIRIGKFCIASLASAILFCLGCTIREHSRWGQSQDSVTFLLAGGTYLSFFAFMLLGVGFIAVLIKEKNKRNFQNGPIS